MIKDVNISIKTNTVLINMGNYGKSIMFGKHTDI